jgi:dihydroflavonol-4-reductase
MILTGREHIAVTGAAGFVGSHLVRCLVGRNLKVRAVINRSPLSEDLQNHPLVEQRTGSITDPSAMAHCLEGIDVLFHLATALGNRIITDDEFFNINREGTRTVLDAAARCGVKKAIHYSSAGVYGKSSGFTAQKEDDPLSPVDVYERSKLAGEEVALSFSQRMDIVVLRPGWVYGEGDRRTFKLIKQINSGLFFIAGSGKINHSPIYVEDLVKASVLAVDKGANGEIYNVGFGMVPVEAMVETIAGSLSKKIFPIKFPIWMVYPPAFLLGKLFAVMGKEAPVSPAKLAFFMRGKPLDSSKLLNDFGIESFTSFAGGIERTVSWYRENGWL